MFRELLTEMRKVAESHSHSKCMNCEAKPTVEVLWANGHGHAWFCDSCFKEWKTKDGKDDILSVKPVTDGEAAKKFADNKNPKMNEGKEVKYVKVSELLPCPYNREIDKEKVADIKNKIKETGVIKPFVVTEINSENGNTLMITDGHHRHLALKELIADGTYKEDSMVPVVMADEAGVKTADKEQPQAVKEDKYAQLRKSLGICDCGEAMVFNRNEDKLICRKCNPSLPPDREMTAEEKKKADAWDEAEHEHLPA